MFLESILSKLVIGQAKLFDIILDLAKSPEEKEFVITRINNVKLIKHILQHTQSLEVIDFFVTMLSYIASENIPVVINQIIYQLVASEAALTCILKSNTNPTTRAVLELNLQYVYEIWEKLAIEEAAREYLNQLLTLHLATSLEDYSKDIDTYRLLLDTVCLKTSTRDYLTSCHLKYDNNSYYSVDNINKIRKLFNEFEIANRFFDTFNRNRLRFLKTKRSKQ